MLSRLEPVIMVSFSVSYWQTDLSFTSKAEVMSGSINIKGSFFKPVKFASVVGVYQSLFTFSVMTLS